jgi:predicted AAA+ superfamily ATPase
MNKVKRLIEPALDDLMSFSPAVVIDGPRGVGKTTLGKSRSSAYLNLEVPAIRELAQTQPDEILAGTPPIFIDEWHLAPEIIGGVRRSVDANRQPGHFLLAGSRPLSMPHSGIGRLSYLRLRTMTLQERGISELKVMMSDLAKGLKPVSTRASLELKDYARAIVTSGFPAFFDLPEEQARFELFSYLAIMSEGDLQDIGAEVRRPIAFRNWLRSYAAATATTASYESIRKAARMDSDSTPARNTTDSYFDLLKLLRIIDDVEAFPLAASSLRRVHQSPKHGLVDPGLTASLLGLNSSHLMLGHPGSGNRLILGQLFESLVTLHLKTHAALNQSTLSHYREWDGRSEVDLILEAANGDLTIIEVKLSAAGVKESGHLEALEKSLGGRVKAKIIITAGQNILTLPNGVAVVPLGAIDFS